MFQIKLKEYSENSRDKVFVLINNVKDFKKSSASDILFLSRLIFTISAFSQSPIANDNFKNSSDVSKSLQYIIILN